jgi:hypothetical protein
MTAQTSRVNVNRITVGIEDLFEALGQRITAIVHTVFVRVLP